MEYVTVRLMSTLIASQKMRSATRRIRQKSEGRERRTVAVMGKSTRHRGERRMESKEVGILMVRDDGMCFVMK